MTGKERLEKAEKNLKAEGVQDVKFFLGESAEGAPLEKIKEAAASILEAIQSGNNTVKHSFDYRKKQ